jgi:hypothetical protein
VPPLVSGCFAITAGVENRLPLANIIAIATCRLRLIDDSFDDITLCLTINILWF